ncbi:AAA family ATPase [Gephyromycinifex aptenodytis]|uniref:AAA family ATPase n=1 Tax=Gephyromycinifex aptenodytis TaxID=2716227 RepID=UPI0014468625|nr:ATP-binding protein [Gephyromycinifex aptenodytis]
MSVARLTELRLDAFKSFRGATLPLSGATILTGRNSSGKSNALDGLEVLARLASGEDIGDALDGRKRESGAIRGGSAGCPPHGEDAFALGCTVVLDEDEYVYTVRIAVAPEVRVVEERLEGPAVKVKSGKSSQGVLFHSTLASDRSPGINVEIHNGKRGPKPSTTLRDNRLALSQIHLAIAGKNSAEGSVLRGAEAVSAALRGVFHLDPVPHLMRDFVPARDTDLRRTGQNLSAALYNLKEDDPDAFQRVVELLRNIADDRVEGVTFVRSDLEDVMVALNEVRGLTSQGERTPAREMSDGILRFMAVATALLSAEHGLDIDDKTNVGGLSSQDDNVRGGVLVVLEELENGLHPSQARRVLDLVRESAQHPRTGVLITTHSPALLDAAEGNLNESVVVCHREPDTGYSTLTRLTDLPGYAAALAQNTLGNAITGGHLTDATEPSVDTSEFERLLGIA